VKARAVVEVEARRRAEAEFGETLLMVVLLLRVAARAAPEKAARESMAGNQKQQLRVYQ